MTSSGATTETLPRSEVSESSHDIIMSGSISSDDAAAMEVDSQAASLPQQEEEVDDQEASQEAQPAAEASEETGSPGTPGLSSGTLPGAEVPSGLLATEDAKPVSTTRHPIRCQRSTGPAC